MRSKGGEAPAPQRQSDGAAGKGCSQQGAVEEQGIHAYAAVIHGKRCRRALVVAAGVDRVRVRVAAVKPWKPTSIQTWGVRRRSEPGDGDSGASHQEPEARAKDGQGGLHSTGRATNSAVGSPCNDRPPPRISGRLVTGTGYRVHNSLRSGHARASGFHSTRI